MLYNKGRFTIDYLCVLLVGDDIKRYVIIYRTRLERNTEESRS
jgi:hypothetical protein